MRRASLRSTLDLQKKRIIFKEINDDDPDASVALEYNKGSLNDYRLGSANIKGYFLLTLPYGQFPKRTVGNNMKTTDTFMKTWALEKGILDEDSPYFNRFANNPSDLATYLAPGLKTGTKEFEIFLKFTVCNWCMDDFIDTGITNASTLVSSENLQKLREVIQNILDGKYLVPDKIPKLLLPFFNSACLAMWEVSEELRKLVPNYQNAGKHFVDSVGDWLNSISIFAGLMGKNWQSDICYMNARKENGQRVLFEIVCLLKRVYLGDDIRKTLPCKIFYDAGDYVTSLANDIFSLETELSSGEFSCNMILRKCVLKKMSLQLAVDFCRDMVNDSVIDMNQAGKDLLQLYPDNKAVKMFVDDYRCFVDGNLFFYADHRQKYGDCNYTIKKVIFEDCLF